ncbi:MBL fold metallo-hydrolase [Oxynema aestuarii]|jgi:phosphoribosyl 1,2-cyclic phosphodiesterase|uniref:MBL fold metallo-hydrolase n=1 Tax=Oxynema aestuarii AP17 TaxID=2064643 RepID=A0A6H1U167_9CYAN|nr:MBL fold metallo-hydrolase [Oxynema aestuarii]QIZ71763.1 MBL fold metallo-hydrolase [Oxynema aestuarii AP17]RMH74147.1 MAG: MBL fold metallo-hydrolase [Cyanobacteria bacterium J007]
METSPSSNQFVVQFWGVRGSVPAPGKDTVRYGGNTSCIEMRIDGKRLIFDAGTGLQMLGQQLQSQMPVEAYMFFTHYHWDHIQGFPFFTPAFIRGNSFKIHGALPPNAESIQEHFIERILHPNSPVPLEGMQADINFYEIVCGENFKLDDIKIETGPLNHPNTAMGYRVTWNGHSVFYCTDTEHFPDRIDENVLELAQGADVLIYDAMYTDEEYHNPKSPKIGWGHSTWQEGVKVAREAGVKQLVIFHHDPTHHDDFLDEMAVKVRGAFPNSVLAREGLILDVLKSGTPVAV